MTSLPDHESICHVRASVIQRSRGRSAVAASAYRAAERLTDARTGEVWDYSRKRHVMNKFMTAPDGTPAWALDRESLWSRAELAERRRDAQTAREVTVSIPRDLPPNQWRSLLDDVVAPYVAAGAIADVAVHCPPAADGQPQPHAHILLTTRALDAAGPQGFAATRNLALAGMFESGGRLGAGHRGDALKAERERVATVINRHLAVAGSRRRADARSYQARGDPRIPEPRIGEQRLAAVRRARRHDRRTAVVSLMRQMRRAETELTRLEADMAVTTRAFPRKPSSDRTQDFKTMLLKDRYPDVDLADIGADVHLVDVRNPGTTRVLTRDGGWIEIDDRSGAIYTWGSLGSAAVLAERVGGATGYPVERLNRSATAGRPGGRRKLGVAEVEALSLADRWRRRGYSDVTESTAGVVVTVGHARLVDTGDHVAVYGTPSDDAIQALVSKAAEDWDGGMVLTGVWSEEAKARVWLECQRRGVDLADYEPSPALMATWEAESGASSGAAAALKMVRTEAATADVLLAAASGDVAAVHQLDPDLRAFVTQYLDDEQRLELARQDRTELVPELGRFRALGAVERSEHPKADVPPMAPLPPEQVDRREVRL